MWAIIMENRADILTNPFISSNYFRAKKSEKKREEPGIYMKG